MQMQSTYWLEKVLQVISLYVDDLLRTLQHTVIHTMQLSGVHSENSCATLHNNTRSSHGTILNEICVRHDKLRDLMHLQQKRTIQLQG